ncbi:maleylpyruvate isomerase family mycothiol-dependent enzyme [Luteipulveratus sp. YIM 133132]|uniref:maleylpyruvate isomerase family mycothiol-dependent enzyme n=1 Tax=Luteipulveratus flavus TaxID=3031728 RepID=UPI0023B1B0D3|nr:maleylpyruvate isomerase family mycothiol-dependent enzyme [Luteipulveratus sp. YIM 133132]MDE9367665.1 maleylpyruvate isomerase family mycothiol-dependent enzyme [Luteipulveratus sp. YIM 133132]
MPTTLPMAQHLEGIALATARLDAYAQSTGLEATVPTCRGWTVSRLIAHLGMVHRWATAIVRELPRQDTERLEEEGLETADPLTWLGHGSDVLRASLRRAPADLDVFFFLNDAPAPREAWARRQCHETTVHAVDALSAQLGRVPTSVEADIPPEVAADGVDELLSGFATRPGEGLTSTQRVEVDVRAVDTGDVWRAVVSDGPLQVVRTGRPQEADSVVTGTAAQLYLGLWNRGEEMRCEGRDVVSFWRDRMQVTWG